MVDFTLFALLVTLVIFLGSIWEEGKIIEEEIETLKVISKFSPHAKIKSPTVLFGKKELIDERDPFFTTLIEDFWIDYNIETFCEDCTATYSVKSYLEPISLKESSKWRKTLPYETTGVAEGNEKKRIDIELNFVEEIGDKIQSETGVMYTGMYLVFLANIEVVSKKGYKRTYQHEARIKLGNSLFFENLEFRKTEKITKKVERDRTIEFGNFSIKSSKLKLPLFISIACVVVGVVLNERESIKKLLLLLKKKKDVKSFRRKYSSLIVGVSRLPSYSDIIMLDSLEDLGKLAYELERPIFETHDVYCVLHDGHLFAVRKEGVEYGEKKKQA